MDTVFGDCLLCLLREISSEIRSREEYVFVLAECLYREKSQFRDKFLADIHHDRIPRSRVVGAKL